MPATNRPHPHDRTGQEPEGPGPADLTIPAEPILLDAYAAHSCPVKTHNRYDLTVKLPAGQDMAIRASSEAEQELFTGAAAFRQQVFDVMAGLPGAVDLRPLADRDWAHRVQATSDAVRRAARLVIAPTLPRDSAGHRCGQPDLLLLGPTRPGGGPGYRPVLVKRHRVLEAMSHEHAQECSPLAAAPQIVPVPGCGARTSREGDLLQLAHHWRLLEAAGWQAGGEPLAGLIGTDRVVCQQGVRELCRPARGGVPQIADTVITWADLAARRLRTYARASSQGWRLHSALERYDHEFGFRLKVAEVAAARRGLPGDPEPRVRPIVVPECDSCPWWLVCKPQLDEDDLSLRIDKARLDPREISVLRAMGISTIEDLAAADLDELLPGYLPEVQHRPGAEQRLRLASQRAGLLARGQEVQRTTTGRIPLPPPGYAIDLDIETSARDRVYLWGFLVDDPADAGGPRYVHFSRFEELDDAAEQALAAQAMGWLAARLHEHPEARVYHYSDFEVVHIRRIAGQCEDPAVRLVAELYCPERFVDLFPVVQKNFFGAHGLGLKAVAHQGAGFSWRDEDPGGLNSQYWFAAAVHGPEQAGREACRRRVLEYNEDDVRATRALRGWLRDQR